MGLPRHALIQLLALQVLDATADTMTAITQPHFTTALLLKELSGDAMPSFYPKQYKARRPSLTSGTAAGSDS